MVMSRNLVKRGVEYCFTSPKFHTTTQKFLFALRNGGKTAFEKIRWSCVVQSLTGNTCGPLCGAVTDW